MREYADAGEALYCELRGVPRLPSENTDFAQVLVGRESTLGYVHHRTYEGEQRSYTCSVTYTVLLPSPTGVTI